MITAIGDGRFYALKRRWVFLIWIRFLATKYRAKAITLRRSPALKGWNFLFNNFIIFYNRFEMVPSRKNWSKKLFITRKTNRQVVKLEFRFTISKLTNWFFFFFSLQVSFCDGGLKKWHSTPFREASATVMLDFFRNRTGTFTLNFVIVWNRTQTWSKILFKRKLFCLRNYLK